MTEHFLIAYKITMEHEGLESNNPKDPGGHTFMGVSRVYWPLWIGWKIIDQCRADGTELPANIVDLVQEFYWENFWVRVRGDEVASLAPSIAYELFDTGVNLSTHDAVRIFQEALNMQTAAMANRTKLMVDGKFGPQTMEIFKLYMAMRPGSRELNRQILLACMNGEQYIHYKNNPRHTYFRGWFLRT